MRLKQKKLKRKLNQLKKFSEKYKINSFSDRKNIGIWVNNKNKIKKIGAIGIKIKKIIKEKTEILKSKRNDLEVLSSESQGEENKLVKEKTKAAKRVENSLLLGYEKLVERQRNGLAVVKVKRNACGGCFNIVPPQRQTEIKEKKKIILCEYCGRIFADVIVEEVKEKKPVKRTKSTKKTKTTKATKRTKTTKKTSKVKK